MNMRQAIEVGEVNNCTTTPTPRLCFCFFLISTALPKELARAIFTLLFCLQYRCMLSSTDQQREINWTFRPWFIYDCATWALRTLEMQMVRPRNFVSHWEHREHFSLTVSRSPQDAMRRSCRVTVSNFNVFQFSHNLFSLALGVIVGNASRSVRASKRPGVACVPLIPWKCHWLFLPYLLLRA